MKQHALSSIFPALPDEELQSLAADIKAHGLHSTIVLYKGDVLDGWHRYKACEIAKVNPRTIDYKGGDPVAFVRSANWHRRHLSVTQRSLAQVQLSEWTTAGNQPKGAILHPPLTVSQMATTAGVSERSIQHAKQVEEHGSPALKTAVKAGDVAISTAAKIAQLPKKDQAAAIVAPPEPQYTPLDAAHDQIGELQSALALAHMEGTEKEKDQAKNLIAVLKAEIKTLTETLKAVTISRDTLQNELAAMKRHNISLQKKIDKK